MAKMPAVAIVGATGLVGNEMLSILSAMNLPIGVPRLLASEESAGEVYAYGEQEAVVEKITENSFAGVDIALFALSAELAQKYVPAAVEQGAWVIDNSSLFRMDPAVPLVVPEVNLDAITEKTRLIANPNCSTIQLVPVLKAVHEIAGLKRVVVSTYQSVSGAGKFALDELWEQTLAIFNQRDWKSEAFPHQIAFNCIPQIDLVLENGYTKEEMKIINESRKILSMPDLRITSTAVRVPVLYSHAESVNIETEREISPARLCESLSKNPAISVYSEVDQYPLQVDVAGTNEIHVGRVRRDDSVEHGISLWIVADNVRKGAALNAIQIAKCLIDRMFN